MTKKYVNVGLLLGMVGLLFLTACGPAGVETQRLGGLPEPPPGAEVLPEEELGAGLDQLEQAFRQSQEVSNTEIEAYVLPTETTFASVKDHYSNAVGAGWDLMEAAELEMLQVEGLDASVWSSEGTNEILSIQYMAVPEFGGNILIVLYAEE